MAYFAKGAEVWVQPDKADASRRYLVATVHKLPLSNTTAEDQAVMLAKIINVATGSDPDWSPEGGA